MATARKRSLESRTMPTPQTAPRQSLLASPLDADSLRLLYAAMLRCRLTARRLRRGTAPAAMPWESIVAGSTIDLQPRDLLLAPALAFAAALVQQFPAAEVLAQAKQRRTPTQPPDSTAEVLLATGAAIALGRDAGALVTVLPSAMPATLEPWHAALRLAAARRLPVIYVIDVAEGDSSLASGSLRKQAAACGLPAITVDGHDVVAVLRVCQEAREKARQGYGPTLVECCTFASGPHARDPLAVMKHYLAKRGYWDKAWHERTKTQIEAELAAAALPRSKRGKPAAAPAGARLEDLWLQVVL